MTAVTELEMSSATLAPPVLMVKKPPFLLAVIHQEFKVHVPLESYVIKGNDAIVKCEIPSFVGDLVKISSWVDSSGKEYPASEQFSFGKWQQLLPPDALQ